MVILKMTYELVKSIKSKSMNNSNKVRDEELQSPESIHCNSETGDKKKSLVTHRETMNILLKFSTFNTSEQTLI